MRRERIERWSRGDSVLHRMHAVAKIAVALTFLISIGTITTHSFLACFLYLGLMVVAARVARIPVMAVLEGAAVVLPFALCFGVFSFLAGEAARAGLIIFRAWLSAQVVFLLVATTSMPRLIAGFEFLYAPRYLLQVMQFLYRYLSVLAEEAAAMIHAGSARAGSLTTVPLRQGAAIAGVLFARSYSRAQAIHQAMISRGFEGRLPVIERSPFSLSDAWLGLGTAALVITVRAAAEWV